MRRKLYRALFVTGLIASLYCYTSNRVNSVHSLDSHVENLPDTASFILRKGDILVRPNLGWLPGSCSVENGRKFGHVAIVTEGAAGKTIEEALAKALVIEAVVYDQETQSFIFKKIDQVRETKAIISFGPRFKGIRYRLRMNLTDDQTNDMLLFLKNQMDGEYKLFSVKKYVDSAAEKDLTLKNLKDSGWHCANIAWEAFYLASGLDIDANKGFAVYPADIITSPCFDLPGGRIRF